MSRASDTYWQKLRRHPGVPVAGAMTLLCAVAGAPDHWIGGALVGAVWWLPVLWTARTQP